MKKATTSILLIEELTDLLYELNDIYNVRREVQLRHPAEFDDKLSKVIFYTALSIGYISLQTSNPRSGADTLEATFKETDVDEYVDMGDLKYLTSSAYTHIERLRMAYGNAVDADILAMLEMIELYLKDAKFYIDGK